MNRFVKHCCFFYFLIISALCFGQTQTLGTWNIVNLTYHLNKKWSFFGEGQIRSLHFYNHFHYYEYKGGFLYQIHPNVKIGLAMGSYQTYQENGNFLLPKSNNEFRIWPQAILSQSFGKLNIEQRYRAEMRLTSKGYRNRFRYRLSLNFPFGKQKQDFKPFQIGISDEIFFSDIPPYFARNRFLLSFQYRHSKNISFLVGRMQQFDYNIDGSKLQNYLQIGMNWDIFRPTSIH